MERYPYYIVIWKDAFDKIHRSYYKYSTSKAHAMFTFSDMSVKVGTPIKKYLGGGVELWTTNAADYKPLMQVLYIFTVNRRS